MESPQTNWRGIKGDLETGNVACDDSLKILLKLNNTSVLRGDWHTLFCCEKIDKKLYCVPVLCRVTRHDVFILM